MENLKMSYINNVENALDKANYELPKISRGGYKSLRKNYNICLEADFYADVA